MENSILYNDNKFLISYPQLLNWGISRKTIDTWTHRNKIETFKANNQTFIYYDHIPFRTKEKLPTESVLIELLKDQNKESLVNKIYTELKKAEFENTSLHRKYYAAKYNLTPDKITLTARLHAVWEKLLEIQEGYSWLKSALKAFNKLFPNKYTDYNSFANVVSKAKNKGIESVAYNGLLIKEKMQVYNDMVYTWLRALSSMPLKLTNKEIGKKIVDLANEAKITNIPTNPEEWVKKHRRELLKANHEIFESRYGTQEAKKREPFAKIAGAKNPLTQVQIDGFTVPVYYKNEKTAWAKVIVFAVLDSHSKMIIGYEFGESEDTALILKSLHDAISKTNCLPYEILSDNHSANKTDEVKYFKEGLNSYGVHWRVTENPQFKTKIERTFKHLNENYFKNIPGWTGQGALTRDRNGKPSQEYIDNYQKADCKRTKDEIMLFVTQCIEHYNNTPLENIGKSPAQIFAEVEKPHAVSINLFERVKLFTASKKATVRRGQIDIIRSGIKYEFQLNAEQMSKYNNQEVFVRYEDLNESIYLYELKNDLPIGEVKPKIAIHGALADQTDEDHIKLLKNKGRTKGYKTKARKENEKFAHPDAIHHLNKITTPKDIVKEFQEDSDLKRIAADKGINVNNVTTGNNSKDFVLKSLRPKENINSSPLQTEKDTIEQFNINDYLQ